MLVKIREAIESEYGDKSYRLIYLNPDAISDAFVENSVMHIFLERGREIIVDHPHELAEAAKQSLVFKQLYEAFPVNYEDAYIDKLAEDHGYNSLEYGDYVERERNNKWKDSIS
ncbi:MAG: hypothetical protein IJ231_02320 [Clostridia bacterium]|nr:hypothetical protein [Clostridia bacterium]